jgi:hypothetical protein
MSVFLPKDLAFASSLSFEDILARGLGAPV